MPVRAPDLWNALDQNPTPEAEKWSYIAAYRKALLRQSDWTRLDDITKNDGDKQAAKDYRKLVRDIPSKPDGITNPDNIIFPDPPFPMDD